MKTFFALALLIIVLRAPLVGQSNIWQEMNAGISMSYISGIAVNASDNIFVWHSEGYSSALYRSQDDGASWTKITNVFTWNMKLNNQGDLFVSGYGNIINRSADNGDTWKKLTGINFSEASPTFLQMDDPRHIFVQDYYKGRGDYPGVLYYSNDNGDTWSYTPGPEINFRDVPLNSVAVLADSIFFVASPTDVYVSVDAGKKYHGPSQTSMAPIRALIPVRRASEVYLQSGKGIYCSRDTGKSWEVRNSGLASTNILSLIIDPRGKMFAGTDSGLFSSINKGVQWVSLGMGAFKITSILLTDTTSMLVTTNNGIYFTINGGKNWSEMNAGLPSKDLSFLTITPHGHLFVACSNKVFRTGATFSIITSVNQNNRKPEAFVLDQNYPNPFNPTTTISFSLPSSSFVSLKIFDVMGRDVTTIASEELPAGSYSRSWNASEMPSGVYFYRLQAGGYLETKKLLLIR